MLKNLKQIIITLEKDLLARAIECAREVLGRILEQIDSIIQRHRPTDLVVAHKRSTWYRTWLEPISITRRQYKDQNGKYRYLLDELIGMEKYRHTTFAAEEIACRLAAEMSFRRSAEVLSKTTSIDLSYRTIHRLVQAVLVGSRNNSDRAISIN